MSVNDKDCKDISNDIDDSTPPVDGGHEDILTKGSTVYGSDYVIYGKKSEVNCIYHAPKDCAYYELNNCAYKELSDNNNGFWECPSKTETGCADYRYECDEVLSKRAPDTAEQVI